MIIMLKYSFLSVKVGYDHFRDLTKMVININSL